MTSLFGTSGIRRKVEDLPKEFVLRLASALGTYSQDREIAIAMDTRKSSPELKDIFIQGLNSTGHSVVDLGVVPSPTLALASADYGTGVVITASHNPPEYNGFKLCRNGMAFLPEHEQQVERIFHSREFSQGNGSTRQTDYREKHLQRILEDVGNAEKKVKVLLDCANGAGSVITPTLLERMGCDVISINTELNGEFPHGLEPREENLRDVCKEVKNSGADLGLVHDGDADRTAAIAHDGKLVEWDSYLSVLAHGKSKVVTTVDASMRIETICRNVVRTRIGDVAVAKKILETGAEFGGEPSGSFIFPKVNLFPDGILTAAKTVKLLSQDKFYSTLEKIPSYPMKRLKIPCPEEKKSEVMEKVHSLVEEADYTDGVRITREEGWFLIRPSGTEPFMRITAEGKTKEALLEFLEEGKGLLEKAGI